MMNRFKRFEGSPNRRRKDVLRITLSPRSFFALNRKAFDAIGSPAAIALYFDEQDKKIALRRCDPEQKYAFPVRKDKDKEYYVIYAAAFCTHHMIRPKRTVLFDGAELRPDQMLVLDLSNTVNVTRGSW